VSQYTATFLGIQSQHPHAQGILRGHIKTVLKDVDANLKQLCCEKQSGGNYDIVVCPHPSGEHVIHLQREAEGSLGFATFFPFHVITDSGRSWGGGGGWDHLCSASHFIKVVKKN
jgi:hypothetical protein